MRREGIFVCMKDHWDYFNWPEINREAKLRLKECRAWGQNTGEKDTLEYWIAWCAHLNAITCHFWG